MTRRSAALLVIVVAACGSQAPHASSAEPPEPVPIRIHRLLVASSRASAGAADPARDRQEAFERAQFVAHTVRSGESSLRDLAVGYGAGDAPVEWILVHGEPTELSEAETRAAFRLRPGEVSAPIETASGFVVLHRVQAPSALVGAQESAPCRAPTIVTCLRGQRVCSTGGDGCRVCSCEESASGAIIDQYTPP
jgi:hypothetical protein